MCRRSCGCVEEVFEETCEGVLGDTQWLERNWRREEEIIYDYIEAQWRLSKFKKGELYD